MRESFTRLETSLCVLSPAPHTLHGQLFAQDTFFERQTLLPQYRSHLASDFAALVFRNLENDPRLSVVSKILGFVNPPAQLGKTCPQDLDQVDLLFPIVLLILSLMKLKKYVTQLFTSSKS